MKTGFHDVVSNGPKISDDKAVHGSGFVGNGRYRVLGSEEKRVSLMSCLVKKFSEPGYLVLYAFSGTPSTARL